jgi:hypothetical protein
MGKFTDGVIIGIVLGCVLGGAIGFWYNDGRLREVISFYQFESDLLETSLNEEILTYEELIDSIQNEFGELSSENSILQNTYTSLQNTHEDLTEDYNVLIIEHQSLRDKYSVCTSNYHELSEAYDNLMEDYQLALGEIPLTPGRTTTILIEREYEWYFSGRNWDLSIAIPESIADFYSEQDRISTNDYSVYVTHPFDDEFINSIIEKMNVIAIEENLSEIEKVNLVISFVQSLPYTLDDVSTPYDEYPRFPIETLIYGGGDCEDTSILTASLLEAMNYDVVLLSPPQHMAVGINIDASGTYWTSNDNRYYYLETTGEGWEIGECPDEYTTAFVYDLTPIPVLTHSWEASWNNRKLDISIEVSNDGTTIAEDYYVWVAYDAGEGYVWYQTESSPFNLQFGKTITIDLTLDVPNDEYTRLMIRIIDSDGYRVDESFSEWFST